MKTALTSLLLILLIGCTATYPPQQRAEKRLTDIPSFPHQNSIDVFFPGEEKPEKPYFKIQLLEARDWGNVSYSALIDQLKNRAQRIGVDGLIITTMHRWSENESFPQHWQEVTALGIKYKDNVQYLKEFVKTIQVYKYDGGSQEFAWQGATQYDLMGNPTGSVGNDALNALMGEFEESYLVYDYSSQWRHRIGANDVLIRQLMPVQGYVDRICRIYFDEKDRLSLIDIRYPGESHREKVEYNYVDDRLVSRTITSKTHGKIVEKNLYDETGRLIGKDISQAGGEPLFKLDYVFFEENDIADLLSGQSFGN